MKNYHNLNIERMKLILQKKTRGFPHVLANNIGLVNFIYSSRGMWICV